MDAPPPRRRFTRRTLLRLAGAGALFGLSAEAVRVFALTNKHTVIPGKVYRSAQLSQDQLARLIAEKKIRTVVNLRGTCPDQDWYLGECRATHAAGICQEDITLSAKRLPPPAEVRRLIEVLDHTDYPILIHCQRGADRTGLVATVAVLLHTNATLSEARRQLWPRYGHVDVGRTALMARFFDYYERWLAATGRTHTPDTFRHWANHEYCPGPYRAELTLLGPNPPTVPAGRGFTLTIRAKNVSVEPWEFKTGGSGGIQLRYQLFLPGGTRLFKGHAGLLAATVRPGEHIDLVAGVPPIEKPGRYLAHADLLDTAPIDLLDADFVQYGSEPLVFDVRVK
jgi:protein tyrosine phosphatase (PTP) superfamily phosphohydrolase (DUF442 family)